MARSLSNTQQFASIYIEFPEEWFNFYFAHLSTIGHKKEDNSRSISDNFAPSN